MGTRLDAKLFLLSLDETTSQLQKSRKMLEKNWKGLKGFKYVAGNEHRRFAFYRVRIYVY